MINRNTVLVLGAGASAHLGYPLGKGLVSNILALEGTREAVLINSLLRGQGLMEPLETMLASLKQSGRNSIDAFLSRRPSLSMAGRLAIAACLIPHEKPDAVTSMDDQNWYRGLFAAMDCAFEDFAKNRLSIITFNYDRSLEFFLLTCLEHAYHAKSYSDAFSVLEQLEIVHLHGQMGCLPKPVQSIEKGIRKYDTDITPHSLLSAADGIRIISETEDNHPAFLKAHELLNDADVIAFLGFGYDETNLKRLGHGYIAKRSASVFDPLTIFGTTLGLGESRASWAAAHFESRARLVDRGIVDLLRDEPIFLSVPVRRHGHG